MGLRAHIDIHKDWGFPEKTSWTGKPINYDGVGEAFGKIAQELAQGICPVDTGFLKSSIKGSGKDTTGEIEATAEYAQYVEYGTWKMSAQPYFTPAVKESAIYAFQLASMIYQNALEEEAEEMEQIVNGQANEFRSLDGISATPGSGTQMYGGSTQSIHGIEFHQDGSVVAGTRGYYQITPSMWRPGTMMYEVAVNNQAHLSEYRAEAMRRFSHDNAVRASIISSRGYGSRSSSNSGRFGYAAGMYAMGSLMEATGSFTLGLLGGAMVGVLATLLALILEDIFGGLNGPQFSMPEIIIT